MSDDALTDDEAVQIMKTVIEDAGPDGITEDDLMRKASILADHVRSLKVSAAIYDLYAEGRVTLHLTPDESDFVIRQAT
ncbi:hypothetical protein [Streptomyces sp. NPDC051079]|uniref:hypothetical protein n=1 Tax=Streptomyces sp. NPDC051079 TaxID=3155043 RepID=UPI00344B93EE